VFVIYYYKLDYNNKNNNNANNNKCLLLSTEYLLGEAEHFLVLFCDTTRNRKSRKAMEDIASYLRKHENKQSIFLCGEQTFSTQMEEVEFYKRYDNAVFVPLVTASDLQNREFLSCLEKMSSEVSLPSNIVIPVTIYGLNPNSLPTCLQKYRHLKAFHKSSWNLSETLGFVELLCSHYKNLLEEKMLLSLNRMLDYSLTLTFWAE